MVKIFSAPDCAIVGALFLGSVLTPGFAPAFAAGDDVDVELSIRAVAKEVEIFPGTKTKVWSYVGEQIKGPTDALIPSQTYLGPTLQFHRGQKVRIHFSNQLPETSIIHWHGLDVPSEMDGLPRSAVNASGEFTYQFTVENRAGLYWYHPHPHMRTGFQVYQGLAGLLIVRDDEESSLNLPTGDSESVLVLQDRSFDANKQLQYVEGQMDQMMGMYGDTMLVNGSLTLEKAVARGPHRIRILNGSNARTYNLGWEDHRPLQIIGTDGGLLSAPIQKDTILLAPGERLDIWADFSGADAGTSVRLMSLPIVKGKGDPFPVYTFKFSDQKTAPRTLPSVLSRVEKIATSDAVNASSPKEFAVTMDRKLGWTINGHGYEMDKVAPEEMVKLGTTEVWEFSNQSMMAHPLHIHGSQFQVLERSSGKFTGAFDHGWKDTVLLLPGDKVKVIKRFLRPGWFVYHCHILEHEDMTMMRNYLVQ